MKYSGTVMMIINHALYVEAENDSDAILALNNKFNNGFVFDTTDTRLWLIRVERGCGMVTTISDVEINGISVNDE